MRVNGVITSFLVIDCNLKAFVKLFSSVVVNCFAI